MERSESCEENGTQRGLWENTSTHWLLGNQ